MAEQNEIKKVISVDLGNTTTSLKEYKKHIDELRGSLLQLDESSEEYAKIAAEIKAEQDKLNEVMKVGKKDTDAADGSYNKLVQTMAELKKQWRATGDEAERTELGKQILDINNQLKELDASTGNFQRNVGNYENSFKGAMLSLKDGLSQNVPAIGKVNTAFKLLSANPIIAIVGALVTTFGLLMKSIKGSEEQTMALNKAMSVFQPVLNGISNAITSISNGVVWLAQKASEVAVSLMGKLKMVFSSLGFDEWAQGIQNALDKMAETSVLKGKEIELQKQSRENLKREAELNKEISELRAKMSDKDNYTYKERLEFLSQWEKKEKELAEMKRKQAQDEYDLIVKNNLLTASSSKDLDAEAQAYVKLQNATKEYNEALRQINQTKKSIINENKSATKAAENEAKAEEKAAEAAQKALDIINQKALKSTDTLEGELEALRLNFEKEKKILEDAGQDITVLVEAYEKDQADIREKYRKKDLEELKKNIELKEHEIEQSAKQKIFEIDVEYVDIDDADTFKILEREQEIADAKFAIEQELINNKIALQEEYVSKLNESDENYAKEVQKLNDLRQEALNNEKKYNNESLKHTKKIEDEKQKVRQAAIMAGLSSISSMLNSIAEMEEEGSQKQKDLQVAAAVINTLAGSVGAFLQGMSSYPPPYGAIIGGVAAAAATAAGVAQIAKIKSTNKNSSVSSSIAAPSMPELSMTQVSPLLDEQADINRIEMSNVEGESRQEQEPLRVYVLESDITDAQNRVNVVEDNATF